MKLTKNNTYMGHEIKLRKATVDDSRFVHRIRNQEYVRDNFWHQELIDYNEHEKWFKEHFKFYNIIMLGKDCDCVGFVRIMDEEVSIALDEAYSNSGIGRKVLRMISREHPYLKAVIRINNLRSFYAFTNAGFKVTAFFMEKNNEKVVGVCGICGSLVTEMNGAVCSDCTVDYMIETNK